MGLTTSGHGDYGSGFGGGGYVRHLTPEYCLPVYRYSSNTEAIYGGGATAGSVGM